MKKLIRSFVINIAALYIAVSILPGFTSQGGLKTIIYATIVLGLINLLIKPLISLLLLPVNLVTLGAFRWVANVVMLFLLTLIINDLSIDGFTFLGLNYQGFIIPESRITKFWSLVLASALVSLTNAFLFWLAKDEK